AARRMMAMRVDIVLHHERLNLNTVGFVGTRQALGSCRRYAVVPYQWIGQNYNLAMVRRIGESLDLARHCSVENHLTTYRLRHPDPVASYFGAVLEEQLDRCPAHQLARNARCSRLIQVVHSSVLATASSRCQCSVYRMKRSTLRTRAQIVTEAFATH